MNPEVLRECGWPRRHLGQAISSQVHSLVLANKQLIVELRPLETLVCDVDVKAMVKL
jgi:hypothetical protein